jgi:hypothetical protein
MKKLKNNKKSIYLGTVAIVLIVVLVLLGKKKKGVDFKIGVVADDGVALVSISPERKMMNILKLDSESKLWIPEGLGWYRNISVKKILKEEKKTDLIDEVFFYNFGFNPDRIVFLNQSDDWKKKFWIRFRLNYNKVLMKEETMKGRIRDQANLFDEVMVRDFSESSLFDEELLISVFNTSEINGLASFVARRLEWLGFSVMTTENLMNEDIGLCLINYGDGVDESLGWEIISETFNKCEKKYDYNLNFGEIELYFGEEFSSMIKYPSYN